MWKNEGVRREKNHAINNILSAMNRKVLAFAVSHMFFAPRPFLCREKIILCTIYRSQNSILEINARNMLRYILFQGTFCLTFFF
jgi:hypothetical protein